MTAICPYCRGEIDPADGGNIDCPGCGTPHHQDCYAENGGCTVFGCAQAPVDDPKISVSNTEISTSLSVAPSVLPVPHAVMSANSVPVPAAETTPAAPPPFVGSNTPPPPVTGSVSPSEPSLAELYSSDNRPRSRVNFVLLGVFFGIFGVHNFYAGYVRKGVGQLFLTILTCFYGAIVSWIWALIEICLVNKDNDGVQFT